MNLARHRIPAGRRHDYREPRPRCSPSEEACAFVGALPRRALFVSVGRPWHRRFSNSAAAQIFGLLFAIGALASWTSYAVGNSRWLSRLPSVSAQDWNLLTGLVTGAQALVLVPIAILTDTGSHESGAWAQLAGVSIGVAVLASVVGNGLWNRMSQLLPLTLVGQMILFETLFALIYGFLWEHRLPTMLGSCSAFAFVVLSVVLCIRAHRRPLAAAPQ